MKPTIKERPILFSTEMVQAILDGRKTQTRRIMKGDGLEYIESHHEEPYYMNVAAETYCPYGRKGDVLWVRETHSPTAIGWIYKADNPSALDNALVMKWKPSIHMPKDAARIWLEVTGIGVERVRDISNNDAWAEGVNGELKAVHEYVERTDYTGPFQLLWKKINGVQSWNENPWVWVVEFQLTINN